jgi:hypothetical protein
MISATSCRYLCVLLTGLLALAGCGQNGESGSALTSGSASQAQGTSAGKQQATQTLATVTLVSSVCEKREQVLGELVKMAAENILERCRLHDWDPCVLDQKCVKQEALLLDPGQFQVSLDIGSGRSSLVLGSRTTRTILITQDIQRSDGSLRSDLTISLGFRMTLGDSRTATRAHQCQSPLDTPAGVAYTRGLLGAINSVTMMGGDPCVPAASTTP